MSPAKICASCARRIGRAPLGGLAAALLLTALLHLSLLALFKPVPVSVQAAPKETRFTVAVSGSLLSSGDPWSLLHWMKYGDPTLFAKPDERCGFSSYRAIRRSDSQLPAELPLDANDKFSGLNPGRFSMSPEPWPFVIPPPANWLRFQDSLAASAQLELPPAPKLQLPVWLDSSFRPLGQVFDFSGEISRLLRGAAPGSLSETVLSVRYLGQDLPPEIRVVSSSGSHALDILALRSLSVSILSMPDAMPLPGSARLLSAKWADAKPLSAQEAAAK